MMRNKNQNTVIPGLGFKARCWVFWNLTHITTIFLRSFGTMLLCFQFILTLFYFSILRFMVL